MSITLVRTVAAGNALRLFLTPPAGALWWRVLRRANPEHFIGPDDEGAVVVADRCTDEVLLDDTALANGTPYYYRAYYRTAAGWSEPAEAMGIPAATYQGGGTNVQDLLRERLEAGLAVEVARGALKPESGRIQVLAAPFARAEAITLPVVAVVFENAGPAEHGIGDSIGADWDGDLGDGLADDEGWLLKWSLTVSGVSLNPDERKALREALRRVIKANLPVFAEHGMSLVNFSQRDREVAEQNQAPLYFTDGSFDCVAPDYALTDRAESVSGLDVSLIPSPDRMTPPHA